MATCTLRVREISSSTLLPPTMNSQKGQVEIVVFLLVIIGAVVLFFIFSKPGNKETPKSNTSPTISSPASPASSEQEEPTNNSASPSQAADYNPTYRSNGQPSGGLSASTRIVAVSLDTDEKAVCRYSDVSNLGYGAMKVFAHTDSTFHYTDIAGLSEGRGYIYYVKCADAYGNTNTDDLMIYFYVKAPDDLISPVLSNQYPTGTVLPRGTTQTMIGISTNELASCRYDSRQGTSYDSMSKSLADDGTKKYHTAQVTGLIAGSNYNYFVRCKDTAGNVNTGDVMISFSVQ